LHYETCLSQAAREDTALRCQFCRDYTRGTDNTSLADVAASLALIVAVVRPDLDAKLPPSRSWKWGLLAQFLDMQAETEYAELSGHEQAG
jgi:hypothetical protein